MRPYGIQLDWWPMKRAADLSWIHSLPPKALEAQSEEEWRAIMVKFWYKRILAGKATLDDVPNKWHDEVAALLEKVAQDGSEN